MGWLDKVKDMAKGRSGTVEKGIDSAVDQVSKVTKGKYDDKLAKGADGLKEQARKLDTERADEQGPETPPVSPPTTPPTTPRTPPPAPS